jgi:dUTP pyrophosphatase
MVNYPVLRVKKLFLDAQLPVRANSTDSGMDVFIHHFEKAYTEKGESSVFLSNEYCLQTNERLFVSTGLSVAIDPGYEVQVRPRSGNSLKRGLTVLNTPGTIDCSYRGPVNIIIVNLGFEQQFIKIGEKIAQLVVAPVVLSNILEVEDLDQTDRGEGGFGSTGK